MADTIQLNVKWITSTIAILIFLASIVTFAVKVEAENEYQAEKLAKLEQQDAELRVQYDLLNAKIDKLIVQGTTAEIKITRIEADIKDVKQDVKELTERN